MTSLSELRTRANEEFPGTPVEFDDGTSIVIRTAISLSDEETAQFDALIATLPDEDSENVSVAASRGVILDILCLLASDGEKARQELSGESLALLMTLFKDSTANAEDAAKSASVAPRTGPARSRSRR